MDWVTFLGGFFLGGIVGFFGLGFIIYSIFMHAAKQMNQNEDWWKRGGSPYGDDEE